MIKFTGKLFAKILPQGKKKNSAIVKIPIGITKVSPANKYTKEIESIKKKMNK